MAAEGERIRQLAKEAEERNHQRMEEKLKRQQEIAREQREQTEHKNKLQQNERIKEEVCFKNYTFSVMQHLTYFCIRKTFSGQYLSYLSSKISNFKG